MADILSGKELPDEISDPTGAKAQVMGGVDVTEELDANVTVVVLYGLLLPNAETVIQIIVEAGNPPRKCVLIPLASFADDTPVNVVQFLRTSRIRSDNIRELVQKFAP